MKYMLILFATFVFSSQSFAHNEDKFGPHQGYIQMPGAFHTEIVPLENQKFNIYLLDVNIKNPTTENSKLTLSYQALNGTQVSYKCLKEKDFFSCSLDSKSTEVNLKEGSLLVEASRNGKKGNLARYDLPLTLKKMKNEMHH